MLKTISYFFLFSRRKEVIKKENTEKKREKKRIFKNDCLLFPSLKIILNEWIRITFSLRKWKEVFLFFFYFHLKRNRYFEVIPHLRYFFLHRKFLHISLSTFIHLTNENGYIFDTSVSNVQERQSAEEERSSLRIRIII